MERDRYKLCFERAPSGILLETADGTIIEANPACCANLGWSREELIGNKIHMLAHEEIRWKVEDNIQRILNGEVLRHTVRSEHKDGRVVYTALNESKIPLNETEEGIIIVSVDVTELKTKEQELYKSELRIRAILKAIPDMLFMMDREGNYLEVHPGDFEVINPPEMMVGKNHREFGLPLELIEKTESEMAEAVAHNKLVSYEFELQTHGRKQYFETRLVPIHQTEFVGIVRDITEQKTTQARLEQALISAEESANAKTIFLANMSHEMRTPLNGIIGIADLLVTSSLDQKTQEGIEVIKESSQILLELINNVLDFSRIEAGSVEIEEIPFRPISILNSAKSICGLKALEKAIPLYLEIDSTIPDILLGDPSRLRQIMLNLTANAIKFTESGFVRLSLKALSKQEDHEILCFKVVDTGIGISEEAQGKIFNPFTQEEVSTTRKYGGTGLGLAICRSLVLMMNGTLQLESEQGKGSTFTVTVPLKIAPK